jgi:hypothetical protein
MNHHHHDSSPLAGRSIRHDELPLSVPSSVATISTFTASTSSLLLSGTSETPDLRWQTPSLEVMDTPRTIQRKRLKADETAYLLSLPPPSSDPIDSEPPAKSIRGRPPGTFKVDRKRTKVMTPHSKKRYLVVQEAEREAKRAKWFASERAEQARCSLALNR